ncbi:MAG: hypothetical protein IJP74_03785 [Prevotella sp.]|nr:hypothetical protein [Prevotella sp.]
MHIFTHEKELFKLTVEEMSPSERTLNLIRQLAYTYRVANSQAYCLN